MGENGHTREQITDALARLALKGDLGEPVLGNANEPASITHLRPQVLHFSNCQTLVVGNHYDARAFEDLAEFLDHFLFLGSIHSFTPTMEGFPPPAPCLPRVLIRGSGPFIRVPRPRSPEGEPRRDISNSFPVSGRN